MTYGLLLTCDIDLSLIHLLWFINYERFDMVFNAPITLLPIAELPQVLKFLDGSLILNIGIKVLERI